MNYHNITYPDMNNGDGLRVVLWLSGCSHHCYNCQNPQTWNPNSGVPFDEFAKQEIFEQLSKDYISGITLTGGDPLHENNINEVLKLTEEIRLLFPHKTIWLYTGFTWEELQPTLEFKGLSKKDIEHNVRAKIVGNCNVLVDGRYIDEQRDISIPWRGSKNQRCIAIQESLKQNKVVLYCD